MVRLKDLLKKAGKGLVVTAASVLAGATLGPLAAGAVGSFLSKAIGDIGVSISQDIIEETITEKIAGAPEILMELAKPDQIEGVAVKVGEKAGIDPVEAEAALQYGFRELQTTLSSIMTEIRSDDALLNEVLQLASETDAKISELLGQSAETQQAVDEVLRRLDSMERSLDRSFRKFMGNYSERSRLDSRRVKVISQLQRQRTIMASGMGITYDPELYVHRREEERVFDNFLSDIDMSDRNIFLILGNAGLGKTWYMSCMSTHTIQEGYPTFFVPLSHGIKSLTSIFQVETIPALVDLLDPVLDEANEHAFIFLDGLDEMDPTGIRHLLGALASARCNSISFVISCRSADWASNRAIVKGGNELKYFIHEDARATANARAFRINTPVSVMMSEFTDRELEAAMQRYGLPSQIPFDLLPLLRRPYILRLSAQWYSQVGELPSPSSPQFLDLFAGGPEYTDSVFRRLGILTERDSLYATVEKLVEAQSESLPLVELPIDPESSTFSTLVSSGMLVISLDRVGTSVSVCREFMVPLVSLTILRHQANPTRVEELLQAVNTWMPQESPVITKIIQDASMVEESPPAPPSKEELRVKEKEEPRVIVEESIEEPETVERKHPDKASRLQIGSGRRVSPSAEPAEEGTESAPPAKVKKGLSQSFRPPSTESVSETVTTATVPAKEIKKKGLSQSYDREIGNLDLGRKREIAHRKSSLPVISDYSDFLQLIQPMLEDSDVLVRRAAAVSLGLVTSRLDKSENGMSAIKHLLDDNDSEVRIASTWSLALATQSYTKPWEHLDALAALLDDVDVGVSREAAMGMACSYMKIPVIDDVQASLSKLLKSDNERVRSGAIFGVALGCNINPSYAEFAGELLTNHLKDESCEIQRRSALGLGFVANVLEDPSDIVRLLIPLPRRTEGPLCVGASLGLCLAGSNLSNSSKIVQTVMPRLQDPEEDVRSVTAMGIGIGSYGLEVPKDVEDLLQPILEDEAPDTRAGAALGLSLMATKLTALEDQITILKPLCDSKDEIVRGRGAIGVGLAAINQSDLSSLQNILHPLLSDSEREVRKDAVLGLGFLASTISDLNERSKLLFPYLQDIDEIVRKGGVLAMGLSVSDFNIPKGVVLGEALFGNLPLIHDETFAVGIASQNIY
jgi:HEAT repeat protein/anti-anti-sigma regulatory factor